MYVQKYNFFIQEDDRQESACGTNVQEPYSIVVRLILDQQRLNQSTQTDLILKCYLGCQAVY